MASAAYARALNYSAYHSPSGTNLPPIEPLASTETTNTKVEVDSFETCVISQKTTFQESTGKAEQMDTENANELDLFFVSSRSHASTVGSPTANLNNEKMLTNENEGNPNEKGIDNLYA